jgi:hypothetical protein
MANTTLGQIAFEAYNEAVGGKTWDGKPIPAWAEINEKVRNGWEQSALAVVREKQKENFCRATPLCSKRTVCIF